MFAENNTLLGGMFAENSSSTENEMQQEIKNDVRLTMGHSKRRCTLTNLLQSKLLSCSVSLSAAVTCVGDFEV